MYKAIIVDDEKIVRVALRAIVDWESEDFEICEVAGSGETALEAIEKHQPHLVITDIVMPGMDGLELIKTARKSGYKGEFIILTNYQNFSYAVDALQNEVLDYIIKTDISKEYITKSIRKAKKKQNPFHSVPTTPSGTSAPGYGDVELIRQYFNGRQGAFSLSGPHLYLYTFLQSSLHKETLDIPSGTLRNVICEAAKDLQNNLIILTPDTLVILLPEDYASRLIDPENRTLTKIRKLVRLYMNTECGFVLSSIIKTSQDLDRSLYHCQEAAQSVLYRGFESLIEEKHADSYSPGNWKFKKIYAEFTHLINEYRYEEAKQYLRIIGENCEKENVYPKTVSQRYQSIRQLLQMDYCVWYPRDRQELAPHSRSFTLDQYLHEIDNIVDDINKNKIDFSITACRQEILRIDRYIRSNLHRKISLSILSSDVNMSENYISRLFKAETGINIIKYINLIKLEKAKELLLIKDNTIKQVSIMVGYDTPSYFNRLFNKLYGINPTEYIQMIEQLG